MGSIFITFEGGEGAGKSTQIALLLKYLQKRDFDVLCLRDPGGTVISEKIRDILKDADNMQMTQKTEALLYLAARSQMVDELIRPHLEAGKIVICDRFEDSTVVYQGHAGGIGLSEIKALCEFASGGIQPDLTLYLDIAPAIGMSRKKGQGDLDRTELKGLEFHNKVHTAYSAQYAQNQERIKNIPATKSPEEIHSIIIEYVNKLLK